MTSITSTKCVCMTGDAGATRRRWSRHPRLLGDIYVGPYLEHAPDLALVADDGRRGCGYALAVLDTATIRASLG